MDISSLHKLWQKQQPSQHQGGEEIFSYALLKNVRHELNHQTAVFSFSWQRLSLYIYYIYIYIFIH